MSDLWSDVEQGVSKFVKDVGKGVVTILDGASSGISGILGIENCDTLKYGGSMRVETQNIGAKIRNDMPDLQIDADKELDLSKLKYALETHSLKSIREKLINVLGNVFAFLKQLFRHMKKVFYVVTMCLMITDGYK